MEELQSFLKHVDDDTLKVYVNDAMFGTHIVPVLSDFLQGESRSYTIMVVSLSVMQEAAKRFAEGD